MSREPEPPPPAAFAPTAAARRVGGPRAILLALLVFTASLVILALIAGRPPFHADTDRDVLLARDCLDTGFCLLRGPPTSFERFVQGAFWIHALTFCRALGLGIMGARGMLLGLHALAAALIFFAPRSVGVNAPGAGASTWVIYLAASVRTVEYPAVWNPSIAPLPVASFWLCLLALAVRGETLWALGAGAALALSVDAHVVCAGLLPLLLMTAFACARRPVEAVAGALAMTAGTYAVVSPGAIIANVEAVPTPIVAWLVGSLVVSLAGAALRRRALAARGTLRARAVVALALAGAVVVTAIAMAASRHPLAARYFAPMVPPFALALGPLAALVAARVKLPRGVGPRARAAAPAALISLFTLAKMVPQGLPPERLDLADAEVLARHLFVVRGYSYRDVVRHVRGPDSWPLLQALAALTPTTPGAAGAAAREPLRDDLLVLAASRASLPAVRPPDWDVVDLPRGRVAVVRRAHSALDWSAMQVCLRQGAGDAGRCATVDMNALDPDERAPRDFLHRAYLELRALRAAFPDRAMAGPGSPRWTVSFPLRLGRDEPPRVFQLGRIYSAWTVTEVRGEYRGATLPATSVTVTSATGPDARIEFEEHDPRGGQFAREPPPVIETGESETALRALLGPTVMP